MQYNRENIGRLWDEITPKLYGYLINTLKDKDLAEDVLQTTWLKAIEALSYFKEQKGASFSSWLFSIARNECRQYWRKSGREVPFDPEIHDKEEINSSNEYKIFVDQILNKLADGDRELVRLHYISDLPFKEISKILGVGQVALRVRMHRILSLAKVMYKNYE